MCLYGGSGLARYQRCTQKGGGLAQNMAALRALATEGIQRGHMALHARNIAIVAGATGDQIEKIASVLAAEHDVRVDRAKEILRDLEDDRV